MNKFCKECKWAEIVNNNMYCFHPDVNKFNWQYLSAWKPRDHLLPTHVARRKLFSACGVFGRLWEPNNEDSTTN